MRKITFLLAVSLSALIVLFSLVAVMGCQARVQAQSAVAEASGSELNVVFRSQNSPLTASYTLTLPALYHNYDPRYVSPFGVVMYGNIDQAGGLQNMTDAGAKNVTTMFRWATVQPSQTARLNWSFFDIQAQNANAAGVDPFILFTGNPTWAAKYGGGPVTDTQHLVNFVTLLIERYDGDGVDDAPGHPRIRYWSFYAEPDNGDPARALGGKGLWGHNGAGYAAMLKAISPAIHAANPQAKVLIGGLAYDFFEPSGPFVKSFLADTLSALNTYPGGVGAYLDAVAFHYYPISTDVWPSIREKAAEIREIMVSHGAGSLPLLVPEMSYWSSPKFGSSELGQAQWLVQTYVRGLSVDIRLLSWYKVFDAVVPLSPTDTAPDRTSGLIRVDRTLKPAYHAYQTMTRELAFAYYVRPYVANNVEGYVFATVGGVQKTVLWSTSGAARVAFPFSHLRVVSVTGEAVYDVLDNQHQPGAPGDLDGGIVGQIELELPENQPFYVERK